MNAMNYSEAAVRHDLKPVPNRLEIENQILRDKLNAAEAVIQAMTRAHAEAYRAKLDADRARRSGRWERIVLWAGVVVAGIWALMGLVLRA